MLPFKDSRVTTRHLTTDQRVGGSSPFGRAKIKAVTSMHGVAALFVPKLGLIVPDSGTLVLRWCSIVWRLSVAR